MIKKYSISSIGSIYKVSDKKTLACISCGTEIKIEGEIDVDSLTSPEKQDPTVCDECKLEKGE